MGKLMIAIVVLAALTGCQSTEKPVGTGSSTNEMKSSPCAGERKSSHLMDGRIVLANWQETGSERTPCPELKGFKLKFRAI